MPEGATVPCTVRFGPFELSTETGELRKKGIRIRLFGQPIKVLTLLVATPGHVVTREQLQKSLWSGDTFGDFERGLNAAVNRLRENLGDSATEPTYIETVPGRGYRFIGKIDSDGSKHSHPDADPSLGRLVRFENYTLIAFVPKESAVGRAAELVVWVRHELSGENGATRATKRESPPLGGCFFERAFELEVSQDESGTPQSSDILLRLDAPNFKCDQPSKELTVPPDAGSQPCTFLIEPHLPGELVANLELLTKSEKVVASRSIRTRALRVSDDDFRSGFSISFGPLRESYERLRKEAQTSPAVELVQAATVEQQARVLEAAAPKEATVGCSIEVIALVRESDSEGGLRALLLLEKISGLDEGDVRERPFEMEFPLDADGKPLPLSISLRLESPGFEPARQIKKLRVPPTGNSPACTFVVIPRLVGEHVMNLELLDPQEQILVCRSIRTRALPSGVESSPDRTLVTIPLLVVIRGTAARIGESNSEHDETSPLDRVLEGGISGFEVPREKPKASESVESDTEKTTVTEKTKDIGSLADDLLKKGRPMRTGQRADVRLFSEPKDMVISHYRLIAVIEHHESGHVFKAEDLRTGQLVAIKITDLEARMGSDGSEDQRLVIEELPSFDLTKRDWHDALPEADLERYKPARPSVLRAPKRAPRGRQWWFIVVSILVLGIVGLIFEFSFGPTAGMSPTHSIKTPRSVVIANFTNSTGDPAFDNLDLSSDKVLHDSVRLSETKILSKARVNDILQQMNRRPDERLTPELAREVCLRANANAVITGSISLDGTRYKITATALSCHTGQALETVSGQAAERADVHQLARVLIEELLDMSAK